MEIVLYICAMITQDLIKYWSEQQEPGDLNALAYKLGLKSKAPVIKRLKGNCNKRDAITITAFFKKREKRLLTISETD